MKKNALLFLFLLPYLAISQHQSGYNFVIVQEYFSFLSEKNQYNLNELTKFLMNKEGIITLYESEDKPIEFSFDKCKVLYLDVSKEKAFLSTKLKLTLSDCNGKIITESVGSSKEKEYRVAYNYALRKAFESLIIPVNNSTKTAVDTVLPEIIPQEITGKNPDFLYAQKTNQGFNLIDYNDRAKYKLYVSSNGTYFLISGQDKTGILYKSDLVWLFEYIKDERVVTEVLKIKF